MNNDFPLINCATCIRVSLDPIIARHGLRKPFDLSLLWCIWYCGSVNHRPSITDLFAMVARIKRTGARGDLIDSLELLISRGYVGRGCYRTRSSALLFITPAGLRVLADYERRLSSFRPDFSGIRGLADVDPT